MEECFEIVYRFFYLLFPQKINCPPLCLGFRVRKRLTEFVGVRFFDPGGERLSTVRTDCDIPLQLVPAGRTKKGQSHGNLLFIRSMKRLASSVFVSAHELLYGPVG